MHLYRKIQLNPCNRYVYTRYLKLTACDRVQIAEIMGKPSSWVVYLKSSVTDFLIWFGNKEKNGNSAQVKHFWKFVWLIIYTLIIPCWRISWLYEHVALSQFNVFCLWLLYLHKGTKVLVLYMYRKTKESILFLSDIHICPWLLGNLEVSSDGTVSFSRSLKSILKKRWIQPLECPWMHGRLNVPSDRTVSFSSSLKSITISKRDEYNR